MLRTFACGARRGHTPVARRGAAAAARPRRAGLRVGGGVEGPPLGGRAALHVSHRGLRPAGVQGRRHRSRPHPRRAALSAAARRRAAAPSRSSSRSTSCCSSIASRARARPRSTPAACCATGRAVLFCGQSGAGKTTTARLWRRQRPRVAVLSDDRIVIAPRRAAALGLRHAVARRGRFAPRRRAHPWRRSSSCATRRDPGSCPSPRRPRRRGSSRGPFPRPGTATPWPACSAPVPRPRAPSPCFELGFRPDASAVEAVEDVLRSGA